MTFAPDHVSDHYSDGVHIELFGEVHNSVTVISHFNFINAHGLFILLNSNCVTSSLSMLIFSLQDG